MSNISHYYLQMMGITLWQCHKPEHYPHLASQAKKIALPKNCKILIISNDNLNSHSHFITQVLRTFHLDFSQCHIITAAECEYYYQEPDWLWQIGCMQGTLISSRVLLSPTLETLLHSGKAKQHLWQQITKQLL